MSIKNEKKEEIYIPLLNEGVDVFRPTLGIEIEKNIFKVLPIEKYDPEDERWKFLPGSIVRCKKEIREGKEILIATELQNS
ncbi:MAG: hypothetical protein AB1422_08075 [bacterium]